MQTFIGVFVACVITALIGVGYVIGFAVGRARAFHIGRPTSSPDRCSYKRVDAERCMLPSDHLANEPHFFSDTHVGRARIDECERYRARLEFGRLT